MRLIPVFIIKSYQRFLSPILVRLFGHGCVHYPHCSDYSIEAFQKHGLIKGMIKSVLRILNCNPYTSRPYFDPVE